MSGRPTVPVERTPSTDVGNSTGDVGARLYSQIEEMYPICRSVTGDGVRETLAIVGARVPLELHEIASGTRVFDWDVPKEWNIRDAYVRNEQGRKVIDFAESNLHVVGYSVPVRTKMPLADLKEHLFTLPDRPGWIPFRASPSIEDWGFCLTHDQLLSLEDGEYEVVIDSTLTNGALTYGELFLPGEIEDEIHVFTHICHPSLCNDNLSGIAIATELARYLSTQRRRYSYRFVFAPTTIGAITWLSCNEQVFPRIHAGLILAMLGDRGQLTYKMSRRGNAEVDRAAQLALAQAGRSFEAVPFSPFGTDERQYCSPGVDLPVGRLTRTPDGAYPEYHSSADDLDFIAPSSLADSFHACLEIFAALESNRRYVGVAQKGEPQLFRRGINQRFGGFRDDAQAAARLWVLNLSDGDHSLFDITERCGLDYQLIEQAAAELVDVGLLTPASEPARVHG
jgi:aminopeptidase-like protein